MMQLDSMALAFVVVAVMAWDAFRRWLASKKIALEASTVDSLEGSLCKLREDFERQKDYARTHADVLVEATSNIKRAQERLSDFSKKVDEQEQQIKNLYGALSRQEHAKKIRQLSPLAKRKGVG